MAITRNNQQNTRSTTNAASATLASYTPTSGSNSVLVVRVAALRATETTFTLSCTFGGTGMTEAVTAETSSSSRWYRTSIFYLINPTGTGDIVATASVSMAGFIIDAVTLLGAAQSSVVGSTDTDAVTNVTADTSYALTGVSANSLLVAMVMSTCAGPPTWSWTTATEDYDLAGGADTSEPAGSGGYYEAASGGSITLTATRSATVAAQVGCAAEFKMAAASGTTVPVFDHHYRMMRG